MGFGDMLMHHCWVTLLSGFDVEYYNNFVMLYEDAAGEEFNLYDENDVLNNL
jgi:hypothetical protein